MSLRRVIRSAAAIFGRTVLAVALIGGASSVGATGGSVPKEGIGRVHMPISCSADAASTFDRGLALLHSFWYDRALATFDRVIAADPNCTMAYWGAAMTFNHPLWAPPTTTDVKSALRYIARSASGRERSDREAMYLTAVTTLYGDGDPATKRRRDVAYRDAMAELYTKYPDDEAALFYALAIDAVIGPGTDPAEVEKAAALAQGVHQRQPQHPGGLHYLIHIYDREGYAPRGLFAARAYAQSAPAIPHALHMPSHIFLRLGLWDEAARADAASFKASEDAVKLAGQPPSDREFHNLTFEQYARIQMGQFAEARREALIAADQYEANLRQIARGGLSKDDEDSLRDVGFETSMMLGNYMVSTGDYADLGRLPKAADFPDPFVSLSNTFVRLSAAVMRHDLDTITREEQTAQTMLASSSLAALPELARMRRTTILEEIVASAAQAHGDDATAFAAAQRAVAAEDRLPSLFAPTLPPVPAHELFGSMLLKARRYTDARREYDLALKRTPRRSSTLLGLAQSARGAGDESNAARLFSEYAQIRKHGDRTTHLR